MKEAELTYQFDGEFMPASKAIELVIAKAEKMDEVSRRGYLEMYQDLFKQTIVAKSKNDFFSKTIIPCIGVVGLICLLILVFFTPYPSKFQSGIIWIAIAIVAAFCAAAIPGFFEFKYRDLIRAGGALGVFALIYMQKPVIMSEDFSPKSYMLKLYVAKKDTISINTLNVKFEPNSSSSVQDYSKKAISEYYGESVTDSFTCYRKSDGKIFNDEKCTELASDHDLLVISNSLLIFFKNKRDAYDHYNKMIH